MRERGEGRVVSGKVYAVILVGGKGKRLRPLSTDSRPKAFLSVTKDKKTMFRKTLERIKKIVLLSHVLVVANSSHARLVREGFPSIGRDNLLLEPFSRNTAPAIAFTASALKKRFEDALMVVLPADQYIIGEREYLRSIERGIDFVMDNEDAIVVLGIRPSFPATEFGYVKPIVEAPKAKNIRRVERFVEKPDRKEAEEFIKDGRYLWNAGAFIFRARTILRKIEKFAPRISKAFRHLNGISRRYRKLPDISIDYAVMEHADNIYCIEGSYGWRDVGNFESLKKVLRRESLDFIEDKKGRITRIL